MTTSNLIRKPKYLSNSSIALWEKEREDFFLKHLALTWTPKEQQTPPMSIGSAFDARAKSALHSVVYGPGSDPKYTFEALFESQVEPHNRDWAKENSQYVFDSYVLSGAYGDLLKLFEGAESAPMFEFTVQKVIEGVPLLGKPDLRFVAKGALHCIYDWKVKGYCSKSPTSPSKDYIMCRDAFRPVGKVKETRGNGKPHANFLPLDFKGMTIHSGYMEHSSQDYADQLALYSWLMGEAIGDEAVVVGIDELVAKPQGIGERPLLRVAQHRSRVSAKYQHQLINRAKAVWHAIETGHIFDKLSRDASDQRCCELNRMAEQLAATGQTLPYRASNSFKREKPEFATATEAPKQRAR